MNERRTIPRLTRKDQAHAPDSLSAALTGEAAAPYTAPGHPYSAAHGSGIRWSLERLELWDRGELRDVAEPFTATVTAFWGDLLFAEAFPMVTHWWFGSSWTQRVRATTRAVRPDGTRLIWLQAVQDDADELLWHVEPDGQANGPMPIFAEHPENLPLQRRMAALATQAAAEIIPTGQWCLVSSLVATRDLTRLILPELRNAWLTTLRIGAPASTTHG